MNDTSHGHQTDRPVPDATPPTLEMFSNGASGDREEYTFVPSDARGDELLTSWVTVDGAGLVDLVDWR